MSKDTIKLVINTVFDQVERNYAKGMWMQFAVHAVRAVITAALDDGLLDRVAAQTQAPTDGGLKV